LLDGGEVDPVLVDIRNKNWIGSDDELDGVVLATDARCVMVVNGWISRLDIPL